MVLDCIDFLFTKHLQSLKEGAMSNGYNEEMHL